MRNFSICDTRWKNRGHELDDIGALCTANTPFYLVGNERESHIFYQEFKNEITILNKPEFTTENEAANAPIPGYAAIICVSVERNEYTTYLKQWGAKGFKENSTFFQADIFRPVFFAYKYGRIHLDRVEIFTTSYCTLNCKKCIAYIPFFKKRGHIPLKVLIRDLDLLFEKVDFIYKLKILGGEGLLYPHLVDYIEYLFEHYSGRVSSVRIGTNATVIPSQGVLDVCRRFNVMMDVSDYALAIPEKCRLDEVLSLLDKQGVGYAVKRTGEAWLDMGFPDNSPIFSSETEKVDHFHKCAMFCRDFHDGKLYYCCSNFAAVHSGLFPVNENDYLDFRGEISKKEILEYEVGFSPLGRTTFCGVCRGCSVEANSTHIPVAEQMESLHES